MPIALFATCVIDQLAPNIGLAALDVLDRAGAKAAFPMGQTCCGQPFFNAGYRDEAARLARATVTVLEPFDTVVVPSGSCTAMIRVHYPQLFPADDPIQPAVDKLAKRTFEFSEFLAKKLGVTADQGRAPPLEPNRPAAGDGPVTVHDGCHGLRELGLGAACRSLLGGIGTEVRELADRQQCCGFGGAFSVKFDRISTSMGNAKADAIGATGAKTVVTCDPSCLLQIRGILERRGSDVTVVHLAEYLAQRAGR